MVSAAYARVATAPISILVALIGTSRELWKWALVSIGVGPILISPFPGSSLGAPAKTFIGRSIAQTRRMITCPPITVLAKREETPRAEDLLSRSEHGR